MSIIKKILQSKTKKYVIFNLFYLNTYLKKNGHVFNLKLKLKSNIRLNVTQHNVYDIFFIKEK